MNDVIRSLIVVSGAGRGVGHATVSRLVGAGYFVYAGVFNEAEAQQWRAHALAQTGRVVPMVLDVTSDDDIARLAHAVLQAEPMRPLHAVIHIAGIARFDMLELMDRPALRRLVEVNAWGAFALTRALMPALKRDRGKVIAVSSMAARASVPLQGAYAASKAALESLLDAWRIELRPWHIPVVLVEPGGIRTDMVTEVVMALQGSLAHCVRDSELAPYAEAYRTTLKGIAAAGPDLLEPEAVADLLLRIAQTKSPRSRYVVGRDARLLIRMRAWLPDSLWDRMFAARLSLR